MINKDNISPMAEKGEQQQETTKQILQLPSEITDTSAGITSATDKGETTMMLTSPQLIIAEPTHMPDTAEEEALQNGSLQDDEQNFPKLPSTGGKKAKDKEVHQEPTPSPAEPDPTHFIWQKPTQIKTFQRGGQREREASK